MSGLPGISGSLFPSRYLVAGLEPHLEWMTSNARVEAERRACLRWWRGLEAECGPATGLRAIFDLAAMPLAGRLGFRARRVRFERDHATAQLETPEGTPVGLVVLPWATRPPDRWRDVSTAAREAGAAWCLLVAPPFVSVVDANGRAVKRGVDFRLPETLDSRSFQRFWTIARARAFDPAGPLAIDALVSQGRTFQDRVRTDLQSGVVLALDALAGVVRHRRPRGPGARDEALTLVYRILFLLFAEAHDLVPVRHPVFGGAYAVTTLCREALAGGRSAVGLWDGLAAITRLSRAGCRHEDLIVRPFNGRLFARSAAPSLESRPQAAASYRVTARDEALARSLVALGTRAGEAGREEISYGDLGVEELGAVYERVLDLAPATSGARSGHSAQRKQSGTFYTPQSLAEFVVRRTLAPLVRNLAPENILALRIVDPAMGSGAFLVAACKYLAGAYERALLEEGRISHADLSDADRAGIRRLIAERCLAGVDLNPVAVQLARLSLWLTSLAAGKPLTFLDHRLRVGNSLVGTTPDGLWRQRPRHGAMGQRGNGAMHGLFDDAELEVTLRQVVRPLTDLLAQRDDTVDVVKAKETIWNRLSGTASPLEPWRAACDLWCAQWFWPAADRADGAPPPSPGELRAALDAILKGDRTLGPRPLSVWLPASRSTALANGFFHWPLEFADVFYDANGSPHVRPGFDAVIGNPPWEMLRADPRTGNGGPATGDDRRALVRFLRESSFFPSCDRGHVNLYQPFLERATTLARPGGRVGLVLPWSFATDDGAAGLRQMMFETMCTDTLVGLDNNAGLFPIHRSLRFAALIATRPDVACGPSGTGSVEVRVRCGVRTAAEVDALPDEDAAGDASAFPVRLTKEAVATVGGRARRIPDVRTPADLEWLERIARAAPALGAGEGWALTFGRELNASDDRRYFSSSGLAVLEGKCISPFRVDARAATRYLRRDLAERLLPDRGFDHPRLAYRDVSGAANQRTLVAAILPAGVVTTHTLFCLRAHLPLEEQHYLCGLFNSDLLNRYVRMLMGSHVTTSLVEGLPVPPWRGTPLQVEIARLAECLSRGSSNTLARIALNLAVERMYHEPPQFTRSPVPPFPSLL